MKNLLLPFCFLCLFTGQFRLSAQTSDYKNAISYKAFATDFLTKEDANSTDDFHYFNSDRVYTVGMEIGYYRYLNHSFNLGVPFKIGSSKLNEPTYLGKAFGSLDADLIFKLNNGYILKEDACIAPYLYAGVGGRRYSRDSAQWDLQIPLGVGVNFCLGEDARLLVGAERTTSITLDRSSWQFQGGIVLMLPSKHDRDKDGIEDEVDACPDVFGLREFQGCPDTDNDRVPDLEDRCPIIPGTVFNKGCPEIKQEDQLILIRATSVEFEFGKATLLPSAYPVLNDVVSVLNRYPEFSMNINGHTDSDGSDEFNLKLSEDRAKTCYTYLITHGISPERVSYQGFGETKPIADNTTEEGRTRNRRVEFLPYVK